MAIFYVETLVCIAFGALRVKVKVTVAKNRKMVSGPQLEFEMRCCN
jgi:hypothetical protein